MEDGPGRGRGVKRAPGVIEIKLRELAQLFNSLDPTPFPDKDLDAEAEEFIVSWALEHPRDARLALHIHLAMRPEDAEAEGHVRADVHHYFRYKAEMTQRRLRQLLGRGQASLLIGLVFLSACLFAANVLKSVGSGTLVEIVEQSLIIGGWVAMWRPLEIFLYDWWPLRQERRVYERLAEADVRLATPSPGASGR